MGSKLNVCMVSNMYYPYPGGVAEHIQNLAENLRKLGHEVKILTTNYNNSYLKNSTSTANENFIYRIGKGMSIYINKTFAQMPVGWKLSEKIKRIFEKEEFNIIHIHGALVPTLPLLALKLSKSINIITYHAGILKDYKYLFSFPLLLPYHRKLHGHIAVSPAADIASTKLFPAQSRIIPNGVNTDLFNPNVQPLEEFSNTTKKILFVGRFEPRKGLKYLLQALPIIKKSIPDVLLIIIGYGMTSRSVTGYISKQVKNNVKFVGLVTGELRTRYYASCDVCCAPSIGNESFGIVLLEAMATGKPIVASNIAGYRSVVDDGQEGFLVPKCSPKKISEKIITILSNKELAKKMSANGREKAMNYSWQRIAKETEKYYYEIIDRFTPQNEHYNPTFINDNIIQTDASI